MTAIAYTRYQETPAGCAIDLSDNTNLWGVAPSVAGAFSKFSAQDLSRYPSPYSNDLKRAISEYLSVDESRIVTGCGSDDVLDSAIRSFGSRGDVLVQCDPTFSMIPVFAAVSGVNVTSISPHRSDLVARALAEKADVIYLCSPNNPTGAVLDTDLITAIARQSRALVIIDEAYIDFGGSTSLALALELDNVLITRTFSKAFGLAGFRVGYGIGSPSATRRIEAARGPYKVSTVAERVACAVLENDLRWVHSCVAKTIENRARFANELNDIGLPALPSGANFLMVPVPDGRRFEDGLRAAGIAVRRFDALTEIGDALRISIGPWEMLQECLHALRRISR
jgi:histidinol-phosphate aminotransferase